MKNREPLRKQNRETNKKDNALRTLIIVMACFFALFCTVTSILHYNFRTLYEIGFTEQPLWNTLRGNFMYSVSQQGNAFGQHNHTILLLLILPFYAVFQHPMTLMVIQNMIIVLGALPVYFISRQKIKSKILSFVFAVSYLLFPSFYYPNFRTFRAVMLSVTFILFAFYFIQRRNRKLMYVSLMLAIFTTEVVAPIVFMIGLYMLIRGELKHGSIIAVFAAAWFAFSVMVVIPLSLIHISEPTRPY